MLIFSFLMLFCTPAFSTLLQGNIWAAPQVVDIDNGNFLIYGGNDPQIWSSEEAKFKSVPAEPKKEPDSPESREGKKNIQIITEKADPWRNKGATLAYLGDNKVLVVGGYKTISTYEREGQSIRHNPSERKKALLSDIVIIDIKTGTQNIIGNLKIARSNHSMVKITQNKFYVFSGFESANKTSEYIEISKNFESAKTEIGPKTNLSFVHSAVVTLKDGKIFSIGGQHNESSKSEVEYFDPKDQKWKLGKPMNSSRSGHSAIILPDGKILVTGSKGYSKASIPKEWFGDSGTEIYDPEKNIWSEGPPMLFKRHGHDMIALSNGMILIGGGASSIELYNPKTGKFSSGSNAQPRVQGKLFFDEMERLIAVGGGKYFDFELNNFTPEQIEYEPTGECARKKMCSARYEPSMTSLPDGKIFIIGGEAHGDAEIYDPVKERSTSIGSASLFGPKERFLVLGLPNGKVLVAGGSKPVDGDKKRQWKKPFINEISLSTYDLKAGTWSFLEPIPLENKNDDIRNEDTPETPGSALQLPNGDVIFIMRNEAFKWKISDEKFEKLPKLNRNRRGFQMLLVENEIWVVGGDEQSGIIAKEAPCSSEPCVDEYTAIGGFKKSNSFEKIKLGDLRWTLSNITEEAESANYLSERYFLTLNGNLAKVRCQLSLNRDQTTCDLKFTTPQSPSIWKSFNVQPINSIDIAKELSQGRVFFRGNFGPFEKQQSLIFNLDTRTWEEFPIVVEPQYVFPLPSGDFVAFTESSNRQVREFHKYSLKKKDAR